MKLLNSVRITCQGDPCLVDCRGKSCEMYGRKHRTSSFQTALVGAGLQRLSKENAS